MTARRLTSQYSQSCGRRKIWFFCAIRASGLAPRFTNRPASFMEQTDAEIVHFAEDDYFYLPDQFHLAVDFLKQNPDADFVAPYQGLGFYTGDMENLSRETRVFGGKDWNSCVSTTHTFLAKRAALIECQDLFHRLFRALRGRGVPDLAMWMALTKKRVFNPIKFIYWLVPHRFWAGSMVLAWYYCWRQILFGRRYTLLVTPSGHCHPHGRRLGSPGD